MAIATVAAAAHIPAIHLILSNDTTAGDYLLAALPAIVALAGAGVGAYAVYLSAKASYRAGELSARAAESATEASIRNAIVASKDRVADLQRAAAVHLLATTYERDRGNVVAFHQAKAEVQIAFSSDKPHDVSVRQHVDKLLEQGDIAAWRSTFLRLVHQATPNHDDRPEK